MINSSKKELVNKIYFAEVRTIYVMDMEQAKHGHNQEAANTIMHDGTPWVLKPLHIQLHIFQLPRATFIGEQRQTKDQDKLPQPVPSSTSEDYHQD